MLVVLTLLALAGAAVVPRTLQALESARERAQWRSLRALVDSLPLEASRSGRVLLLDSAALMQRLPDWPRERRLELDAPLGYSPEGVTNGATLTVHAIGGTTQQWKIEPFTGRLHAVNR